MKSMNSARKKLVSIVMPCYNEEKNVEIAYNKVRQEFLKLKNYDYEHIFIDNASTDKTVTILKRLALKDGHVKIIVNSRNFGHIKSPYHGLLQAKGDAVMLLASDLQDPPELIPQFIQKWEGGFKIVIGVKNKSRENKGMFLLRKLFYYAVRKLSETELIDNYTGFGLYDRQVIEVLRQINDPYPYLRGIICEIGFEKAKIEFVQPKRDKGRSKNNFYTLYDIAILGIISHSKIPLRLATFFGFIFSILSIMIAFFYFLYKILFWNNFSVGVAPVVIGLFFFASLQLFFLGIVGEYIGAIYTKVQQRPLVIEKERVNFDDDCK